MKKILSKLADEQKFFPILQILLWVLLSISILSFLFITIFSEEVKFRPELSYQGFENFLKYYNFSIKVFAGFIAIYAIVITLRRINQTNTQINLAAQQIKISSEQNRISNYFKFRDEFVKHFEAGIFYVYYKKYMKKDISPNELFYPLYNFFFGSIADFDGKIKKEVMKEILSFNDEYAKINQNDYNDKNTSVLTTFHNVFKDVNTNFRNGYILISLEIANKVYTWDLSKKIQDDKKTKVIDLLEYCINLQLLLELSTFIGMQIKDETKSLKLFIEYILSIKLLSRSIKAEISSY